MNSKIRIRIVAYAIIFILVFFFIIPFLRVVYGSNVAKNYHVANSIIFADTCYEIEDDEGWSDVNPALVGILCYIKEIYFDDLIIFHSGHRPHGSDTSQHYIGNAVDMRMSDYDGMTYCEKMNQYYLDWEKLAAGLDEIKDWIGFGIYPQANNPFFHLDLGGGFRSWARIDMEYVSYDEGIKYMRMELIDCSGELNAED